MHDLQWVPSPWWMRVAKASYACCMIFSGPSPWWTRVDDRWAPHKRDPRTDHNIHALGPSTFSVPSALGNKTNPLQTPLSEEALSLSLSALLSPALLWDSPKIVSWRSEVRFHTFLSDFSIFFDSDSTKNPRVTHTIRFVIAKLMKSVFIFWSLVYNCNGFRKNEIKR